MEAHFKIGDRVQTIRAFSGVAKFTEGMIVEDYGSGMTIAWDLPNQPIPKGMQPKQIAKMWAGNPLCPLRDGFDKETELCMLVKITK